MVVICTLSFQYFRKVWTASVYNRNKMLTNMSQEGSVDWHTPDALRTALSRL